MGLFGKKEKAEDTSTAPAVSPVANANMAEVEEYDVLSDDLLQAIAKIKGRTAPQKAVKVAVSVLYPISAAIAADERRKEAARQKAEEEALKNPTPGKEIAGQGIYLGQYAPKDRAGNSLGKVFNVFAAPQDLPDTMKYIDAVKHIAKLKNWNGHDGTNYATDKELYAALKDGSYSGGWVIPPRDLLVGTEADGPTGVRKGTIIQPDNLFDHRNTGAFKDTFTTAAASGSDDDYPRWYWSSTEPRELPSGVWTVGFSDGTEDWHLKDNLRLSCRPVRFVAATSPG